MAIPSPAVFITPYHHSWYIVALIAWRLSVDHVSKIKKVLLLSFVLSIVVGLYPQDSYNCETVVRFFVFYPFFLMGYYWGIDGLVKFLHTREWKHTKQGILLLSFVIFLFFVFEISKWQDYEIKMLPFENYMDLITRIEIFVISVFVMFGLLFVVPNRQIPFFTRWGENSLVIYMCHEAILSAVVFNVSYPDVVGINCVILIFVGSLILTMFLGSNIFSNKVNALISYLTNLFYDEKAE